MGRPINRLGTEQWFGGFIERLAAAFGWAVIAHERSRQRRALAAMDDHLLKDIGLARADILQESAKPFWRD
ncbi:MAG: DUF1127 domain-containing protein [Dongiaceae bacterium]